MPSRRLEQNLSPCERAERPKAPDRMPPSVILSQAELDDALHLLRFRDRALVDALLAVAGPPPLRARRADFAGLVWIVASQQLSRASANAVYGRLIALLPDLDSRSFRAADDEELRACGLSAPKLRCLKELAAEVEDRGLDFGSFSTMKPEAVRERLLSIVGIGPWTADIFLLFCMGLPDAWPSGDLALQEAVRIALRLHARPKQCEMDKLGERWRPWRGVAARLLWAYYGVIEKPPSLKHGKRRKERRSERMDRSGAARAAGVSKGKA